MDPQLIVTLVTDLGAFGFILWLVHRTFSHTIPRLASTFEKGIHTMQKAFSEAADKQRADFKEMVQNQRSDFERIIQREQAIHEAQTDKMVKAIEDLGRRISA